MFAINPEYMNETVLLDECTPIYLDIGPLWEQVVARVTQWFGVILSLVFLIYYIWNTYKATCGWEELYVCTVECESPEFSHMLSPDVFACVQGC